MKRPSYCPVQAVVERCARKIPDRRVEVIHRQRNAAAWRVEHVPLDHLAIIAGEFNGQLAFAGELEVGRAVLIAEGVAADDDGLGPAWHQPRDVAADDGLAEDHAP
jgi:hypothetical protein